MAWLAMILTGLLWSSAAMAQTFTGNTLAGISTGPAAIPDVCTGATDYLEQATHGYFYTDASWAVAGDPDDECDSGGRTCSAQDLETSSQLADTTDLLTSGLPVGSRTSGIMLDLASDEVASSASTTFIKATANSDWTICGWFLVYSDVAEKMIYPSIGVDTSSINGDVFLFTTGDAGDLRADQAMEEEVWFHMCAGVDNDGGAGGSDARFIIVNGTLVASDVDIDNTVQEADKFLRFLAQDTTYQAHEVLTFSTALATTSACQLMSCGSVPAQAGHSASMRRATYGACTLP